MEKEEDGYKLIAQFEERAKFYCDGFGNEISSILLNVEISPEKNNDTLRRAKILEEIISGMELNGKEEDYDLLSRIQENFSDFPRVLIKIIEGKAEVKELYDVYEKIKIYANAYRVRLNNLRREIRNWFGNDFFKFSTNELSGRFTSDALGKDYT